MTVHAPMRHAGQREYSVKTTVREYLRTYGEVAFKVDLRAETDVPTWYLDQLAATDIFFISLNHNHEYVASKHVIGRRCSHYGFWRPDVAAGEAVFHRQETTTAALKHLAFSDEQVLTVRNVES